MCRETARFQVFGYKENRQPLADSHGFIDSARRAVTEHLNAADDAAEFGHDSGYPFANARNVGWRDEIADRFEMAVFQFLQIVVDAGLIAAFGVAGGVEEEVGDLRHGGDHREDGAAGGFGGDEVAGQLSCGRPSQRWCRRIS